MAEPTGFDLNAAAAVARLTGLDFFADPLAALFGHLPGDLQVGDFVVV